MPNRQESGSYDGQLTPGPNRPVRPGSRRRRAPAPPPAGTTAAGRVELDHTGALDTTGRPHDRRRADRLTRRRRAPRHARTRAARTPTAQRAGTSTPQARRRGGGCPDARAGTGGMREPKGAPVAHHAPASLPPAFFPLLAATLQPAVPAPLFAPCSTWNESAASAPWGGRMTSGFFFLVGRAVPIGAGSGYATVLTSPLLTSPRPRACERKSATSTLRGSAGVVETHNRPAVVAAAAAERDGGAGWRTVSVVPRTRVSGHFIALRRVDTLVCSRFRVYPGGEGI